MVDPPNCTYTNQTKLTPITILVVIELILE